MLFRLHQKEIKTGHVVETTTNSLYCIPVEALLTQTNTSMRVSKRYNSTQQQRVTANEPPLMKRSTSVIVRPQGVSFLDDTTAVYGRAEDSPL